MPSLISADASGALKSMGFFPALSKPITVIPKLPDAMTLPLLEALSENQAKVVPTSMASQSSKDSPLAKIACLVDVFPINILFFPFVYTSFMFSVASCFDVTHPVSTTYHLSGTPKGHRLILCPLGLPLLKRGEGTLSFTIPV